MSDAPAPAAPAAPSPAAEPAGAGAPSPGGSVWEGTALKQRLDAADAARQPVRPVTPQAPEAETQPQDGGEYDPGHDFDFGRYVQSEEDRDLYDSFGQAMVIAGAPREVVDHVASWYNAARAAEQAELDDLHRKSFAKSQQVMRGEWGNAYAGNLAAVREFMATMPKGLRFALTQGLREDGAPVGNDPAVIRWLHSLMAGRSQAQGSGARGDVATEKQQIEELMRDRNSAYWKGPRASQLQARYLALVGG